MRRNFNIIHSCGKFHLTVDGWEFASSQAPVELLEKMGKWIESCKSGPFPTVWICTACAPGGMGCALLQYDEPDRCLTELSYSDTELQELEDQGGRAPVNWGIGSFSKLPLLARTGLGGELGRKERIYCNISIGEAERALQEDDE
jgi:hypothetical protein